MFSYFIFWCLLHETGKVSRKKLGKLIDNILLRIMFPANLTKDSNSRAESPFRPIVVDEFGRVLSFSFTRHLTAWYCAALKGALSRYCSITVTLLYHHCHAIVASLSHYCSITVTLLYYHYHAIVPSL